MRVKRWVKNPCVRSRFVERGIRESEALASGAGTGAGGGVEAYRPHLPQARRKVSSLWLVLIDTGSPIVG